MTSWWAIDVHIAQPEQTPALAEWLVGPAQIIVCNILLPPNVALLPTVLQSLAPGGVAIFSGMEASESAAAMTEQGFHAVDETLDEGWAVAARC